MQLRKAERKQAKMRVGITAPSGGGKTFSALLMARGLASDWAKIALIDTENGSGELYAHLGPYNVITLTPPFTPERYIEAIHACESAGMDVIILDSASHEWDGAGGCLEINEKLANAKYKGNTWAAWSETTPRHRAFITAVVSCACHIITTTRSKTDTIQTEDKKIKKVGLKEIQREGFEYELTVNLTLDRDTHYAAPSKDRTGLFEGTVAIVTEDTGRALKAWCEAGTPITEPVNSTKPAETPQPVTITAVAEKPYQQDGKPAVGYLLTFSDKRIARTTDAALAHQAEVYRDAKTLILPELELRSGKAFLIEFNAQDQAF